MNEIKKAAVLMDDGFEELEAMGPIALLKRAGVDVDIVAANNKEEVTGRFGITYSPAKPMKGYDFSEIDALILPGGPHYQKLQSNPAVLEVIKAVDANPDQILGAICAAPTILGHLGLLKGKNYTCFTSMDEDFGGTYQDVKAVTDGNLVTGRSAAAAIEFAYALMEKLLGKEKTDEVKASIYDL